MSEKEQAVIPYEGSEPYIFISYSHSDSDAVLSVIERLSESGYRVWYDDGIEGGDRWAAEIQKHVKRCAFLFAFLSGNYQSSKWCLREIAIADKNRKNIVGIYIEDFEFSEESPLEMYVESTQNLFMHKSSAEELYKDIFSIKGLDKCLDRSKLAAKDESAQKCREHLKKLRLFETALDSFSPDELSKAYHDTSRAMFFFEQGDYINELEYAQELYARIDERIKSNMISASKPAVQVVHLLDEEAPEITEEDEKKALIEADEKNLKEAVDMLEETRNTKYPWSDIELPEEDGEEANEKNLEEALDMLEETRNTKYPWSDIELPEEDGVSRPSDEELEEEARREAGRERLRAMQKTERQLAAKKRLEEQTAEIREAASSHTGNGNERNTAKARVFARVFSAAASTMMYAYYILTLLKNGGEGYPKKFIFLIMLLAAVLNDIGTFAWHISGHEAIGRLNAVKHYIIAIAAPIVICTVMCGAGFSFAGGILLPVLASVLGNFIAFVVYGAIFGM